MVLARWQVLVLVLLSFVLRLAWSAWATVTPVHDAAAYCGLAMRFLQMGEMGGPGALATVTPGYPVFLAGLLALDPTWVLARLVQVALGALTTWLVMLLGLALAGRRVALLAGLLHALSASSILYVPMIMTENLALPLVTGAFLLLVRGRYPWVGVLLGLACLVRPACLFLLPGVVLAAALHARAWRAPLALAGAAAVVLIPWVTRNVGAGLGPTFATINGTNLWMGNHSGANGGYEHVHHPAELLPERERERTLARVGREWIRSHPQEYLRICLDRAQGLFGTEPDSWLRYWVWPTTTRNAAVTQALTDDTWGLEAAAVRWQGEMVLRVLRWLVAPLQLLAVAFGFRYWRRYYVLLLPLLTYGSALILTFSAPRYREVVGPCLVVLTAAMAVAAWEWVAARPGKPSEVQRGADQIRAPRPGLRIRTGH